MNFENNVLNTAFNNVEDKLRALNTAIYKSKNPEIEGKDTALAKRSIGEKIIGFAKNAFSTQAKDSVQLSPKHTEIANEAAGLLKAIGELESTMASQKLIGADAEKLTAKWKNLNAQLAVVNKQLKGTHVIAQAQILLKGNEQGATEQTEKAEAHSSSTSLSNKKYFGTTSFSFSNLITDAAKQVKSVQKNAQQQQKSLNYLSSIKFSTKITSSTVERKYVSNVSGKKDKSDVKTIIKEFQKALSGGVTPQEKAQLKELYLKLAIDIDPKHAVEKKDIEAALGIKNPQKERIDSTIEFLNKVKVTGSLEGEDPGWGEIGVNDLKYSVDDQEISQSDVVDRFMTLFNEDGKITNEITNPQKAQLIQSWVDLIPRGSRNDHRAQANNIETSLSGYAVSSQVIDNLSDLKNMKPIENSTNYTYTHPKLQQNNKIEKNLDIVVGRFEGLAAYDRTDGHNKELLEQYFRLVPLVPPDENLKDYTFSNRLRAARGMLNIASSEANLRAVSSLNNDSTTQKIMDAFSKVAKENTEKLQPWQKEWVLSKYESLVTDRDLKSEGFSEDDIEIRKAMDTTIDRTIEELKSITIEKGSLKDSKNPMRAFDTTDVASSFERILGIGPKKDMRKLTQTERDTLREKYDELLGGRNFESELKERVEAIDTALGVSFSNTVNTLLAIKKTKKDDGTVEYSSNRYDHKKTISENDLINHFEIALGIQKEGLGRLIGTDLTQAVSQYNRLLVDLEQTQDEKLKNRLKEIKSRLKIE